MSSIESSLEEALPALSRAVELAPAAVDPLRHLAVVLAMLRRHREALCAFDRLVELAPSDALAINDRGALLADMGQHAAACGAFDRALELRPDLLAARLNRAVSGQLLGRLEAALADYDLVLAGDPRCVQAWSNRGGVLCGLADYRAALTSFDHALRLAPGSPEAECGRGKALAGLGRWNEALASAERALALAPAMKEAWINAINALCGAGRYADALAECERALARDPCFATGWFWHGGLLIEARHDEAGLQSLERALELAPDDAETQFAHSCALLRLGRYAHAWEGYESRFRLRRHGGEAPRPDPRRWKGENPARRTILLTTEQGLGDTIQFCRYAPRVAELGARVVIEAPASLVPLLRTLGAGCQIIATGEPRPDYDWQCPLLSLPSIFGTVLDTVPGRTPYLEASPQRQAGWMTRLPPGLKIGLTASGNPNYLADRHRSVALERLAPLLALPASFHLLQRDVAPADEDFLAQCGRIVDHQKDLGDFAETAALVACMDLVISVDTSVAHLAGALGRPVWVLLAFTADWRWLRDRDDSPWYPSARLFRQKERDDWNEVVSRVATALVAFKPQPI